jgi:hypothetical protein
MPWGATEAFYADARGESGRVLAVLSATDLWNVEAFHPKDTRDFDTRLLLAGHCCGEAFDRRGYPCSNCGQPYCPKCGLCRCQRAADREELCTRCFLKFQPHLVVDGVCQECRG